MKKKTFLWGKIEKFLEFQADSNWVKWTIFFFAWKTHIFTVKWVKFYLFRWWSHECICERKIRSLKFLSFHQKFPHLFFWKDFQFQSINFRQHKHFNCRAKIFILYLFLWYSRWAREKSEIDLIVWDQSSVILHIENWSHWAWWKSQKEWFFFQKSRRRLYHIHFDIRLNKKHKLNRRQMSYLTLSFSI